MFDLNKLRFFEWFEKKTVDSILYFMYIIALLPLLLITIFNNELARLFGHIAFNLAAILITPPILGISIDKKIDFNEKQGWLRRGYIYLAIKLGAFLFMLGIIFYMHIPSNLIDSFKTLQDPSRIITVQGKIIDQNTGLHHRLFGTDMKVLLNTGEELNVQCRYLCTLYKDRPYKFKLTPDMYQMLSAKEIR